MLCVSVRRSKEETTMLQSKNIKNKMLLAGQYEYALHVHRIEPNFYHALVQF